jgi:hypothetical protein
MTYLPLNAEDIIVIKSCFCFASALENDTNREMLVLKNHTVSLGSYIMLSYEANFTGYL